MPEEVIEPPVEQPRLTQERINLLGSKEIGLKDLNPNELQDFRTLASGGTVEAPDTVKVEEPKAEPETNIENPTGKQQFDADVKANAAKQRFEASIRKSKEFDGKWKELQDRKVTQATDDPFDDASQKSIVEENALLKEQVKLVIDTFRDTYQEDQVRKQENYQGLETERGNLSIQQLQRENPDLETNISIEKLDNELTRFSEAVGGHPNVNKYLEDETYKKQVDDSGIIPLSNGFLQNMDKFTAIVDINNDYAVKEFKDGKTFKQRNPDISINSFYMDRLQKSGKFGEMLVKAKLTGTTQAVDKFVSQQQTAPIMKPGAGGETPSTGMTFDKAKAILDRLRPKRREGTKLTDQETEELSTVDKFLYGDKK